MIYIPQLLGLLIFPLLSWQISRSSILGRYLSPIVLCYLFGILLSNFQLIPLRENISTTATEVSILLAIPLLLYNTRLSELKEHGRSMLLAFGLCVLSGLLSTTFAAYLLRDTATTPWVTAGMLVGIYTGGTPNMQAIGLALGAAQESIILMNAADIILGGSYLIFLTSVAHPLLSRLLPSFEGQPLDYSLTGKNMQEVIPLDIAKAVGLTLAVIGLSVGLTFLLFKNLNQVSFLILCLTTFSILASFLPMVKKWKGTFVAGEYFLLVFSVALGMLADLGQMADKGGLILTFSAIAMFGTILLHLVFAKLFRIDRDTFMISSTAAIYGPAFIGQIASVIKNKSLILPGIAMGLLGYAIGNYLGISLSGILEWWLG